MIGQLMDTYQYINNINKIIKNVRIQCYAQASFLFNELIAEIQNEQELITKMTDSEDELSTIMSSMLEALEQGDMILAADIMEAMLIPYLEGINEPRALTNLKNYTLEPTAVGSYTLKYLPLGIYLHSNNDPMEEARSLIDMYFDWMKLDYAVYGLGYGYHILALMEKTQGAVNVKVFERDYELIELAERNDIFAGYAENIEIIYDPDSMRFSEYIANDVGIIMHYPSVKKIDNEKELLAIRKFYASFNGIKNFASYISVNINRNIRNCPHNVDEIENEFKGKDVIVVAAGPSLDDNLEFLKKSYGKKPILCVGTVYSKLQKCGIEPDYVFFMDPQKETYKQLNNTSENGAKLVIDAAAYWEFSERWQGEKYIALQNGNPLAEDEASKRGVRIYDTGGTVTSLAIDVAVKAGAKSIGLVGVDMAYRDGYSHAGIDKRRKTDNSELIKVRGVTGEDVYTEVVLYNYLKWIEKEIENNKQVKFINYSTCGAYINGAEKGLNIYG